MKRILVLTAVLLLITFTAMADSVQGTWTGTAKGLGHSFSASCTFNGSGSFTAYTAGVRVSGGYTVSGSNVTISAKGTSVTFKLTSSGTRQSLTGSGRLRGVRGTAYLSRTVSGARLSAASPFAKWIIQTDERIRELELYESGFAYYGETDLAKSREETFAKIKQGVESGEIEDYVSLVAALDVSATPVEYIGLAQFADGVATITPLNGECPAWYKFKNNGKYVIKYETAPGKLTFGGVPFDYESGADTKPESVIFRPYITLERGDDGEAVKSLQQKLIKFKYLVGKADGNFGPITENAVIAFEREQGFDADGRLSGEELAKLYSTGAK